MLEKRIKYFDFFISFSENHVHGGQKKNGNLIEGA